MLPPMSSLSTFTVSSQPKGKVRLTTGTKNSLTLYCSGLQTHRQKITVKSQKSSCIQANQASSRAHRFWAYMAHQDPSMKLEGDAQAVFGASADISEPLYWNSFLGMKIF